VIKKVQQLIFENELETLIGLQFDSHIQQKIRNVGFIENYYYIYIYIYEVLEIEAIGSRKKIWTFLKIWFLNKSTIITCRQEKHGKFNTNYIPFSRISNSWIKANLRYPILCQKNIIAPQSKS
jgi:hypothetical protein